MTTKQILRLNSVINYLEMGFTEETIVFQKKTCSKDYLTKTRKGVAENKYIKYTSLVDGAEYWSDEISFEIQIANYLAYNWDLFVCLHKDKKKLKNKILATITELTESATSILYGKSNTNLFLVDLDKQDDYEDDILDILAQDNTMILKRFCKIKKNGIVSANNFSGYDLFSISKKRLVQKFKSNNYCILNISDRAMLLHKSNTGKFDSVSRDDPHFFIEMFFREVGSVVLDCVKQKAVEENVDVELMLKYWTSYFIDENDTSFSQMRVKYYSKYTNIVENMYFPHIIYYKTGGFCNLNDEVASYLNEQIESGEGYYNRGISN